MITKKNSQEYAQQKIYLFRYIAISSRLILNFRIQTHLVKLTSLLYDPDSEKGQLITVYINWTRETRQSRSMFLCLLCVKTNTMLGLNKLTKYSIPFHHCKYCPSPTRHYHLPMGTSNRPCRSSVIKLMARAQSFVCNHCKLWSMLMNNGWMDPLRVHVGPSGTRTLSTSPSSLTADRYFRYDPTVGCQHSACTLMNRSVHRPAKQTRVNLHAKQSTADKRAVSAAKPKVGCCHHRAVFVTRQLWQAVVACGQ